MLSGAEKHVSAGIDHITIFFSGAQVERSSKPVTLEKGQHILLVEGLEQNLMENSIRVGLIGGGKILSVVRRMDYLNESENNEELARLEERHKEIEKEKEEIRLNSGVFEQEKNLLLSNIKLGGEQQGVQVSALKEAADFYRTRLEQIDMQILKNSRKLKELEEEAVRIRQQMNELNYKKSKPSSTIEVTVEMPVAGQIRVAMDYYVPGARWQPVYDLRVEKTGEPINMVRKAKVTQTTGLDWDNVRLTFSTGNPRERASKPELQPWYLRDVQPEPMIRIRGQAAPAAARKAVETETDYKLVSDDLEEAVTMAIPEVQVGAKNSLLEFSLTSPASVPSDNKGYTILIGSMDLDAVYEYQTVPKLGPSAYLMALIPDRDDYNLLNGQANIYYEGMFVGETFINATATDDTMQISLGKDKEIMVERKQVREYTSDRIIGSNRKKDFGFENLVRNGKKVPITVIVEDQYPVSTLKDFEVSQEDHGDGKVDKVTGKVTWKKSIGPGETVKLPIRFSVKYPSDRQINL